MNRFWKGLIAVVILAGFGLVFIPGLYAQVGTITRRLIGTQDIYFATGGTGAVETFNYVDPAHNTLTLHKLDASFIKFRTAQGGLPASLENLVDGSNTIDLKLNNLTVAGTAAITGNTTITGTFGVTGLTTFTAIPVGPNLDPSTSNQLTRKLYVDTQVAAAQAAAIATSVQLTGNQTVAGIKSFTSFPATPSSAPTTDYQTANKKYVDDNTAVLGNTLAKAWAHCTVSGATITVRASYNCASVVRNSINNFTVTFTTPFSSAYYVVVGNSGYFPTIDIPSSFQLVSQLAGSYQFLLSRSTVAGIESAQETPYFYIVFYGEQ